MKPRELMEITSNIAVNKTIKRLKKEGLLKDYKRNSFTQTEELLRLYPKLPKHHPERKRIDEAFLIIQDDEYKDIIKDFYFDGLPHSKIADIYGCRYQTISDNRKRIVHELSKELFIDDVIKEIKQL